MFKKVKFDTKTTQGHLCFLYNTDQERLDLIAEYFIQGLDNNELCVFVTHETPEQVKRNFADAGFDIVPAVRKGSLQIFEMNDTYVPDGKFVADYMLGNVSNFIEDAKDRGFSGLRTAGEMRWLADHPEAIDDAISYEQAVNSLNQPTPNFVGLCLYPVQETFGRILRGAMNTHPVVVHHGKVANNQYYQRA